MLKRLLLVSGVILLLSGVCTWVAARMLGIDTSAYYETRLKDVREAGRKAANKLVTIAPDLFAAARLQGDPTIGCTVALSFLRPEKLVVEETNITFSLQGCELAYYDIASEDGALHYIYYSEAVLTFGSVKPDGAAVTKEFAIDDIDIRDTQIERKLKQISLLGNNRFYALFDDGFIRSCSILPEIDCVGTRVPPSTLNIIDTAKGFSAHVYQKTSGKNILFYDTMLNASFQPYEIPDIGEEIVTSVAVANRSRILVGTSGGQVIVGDRSPVSGVLDWRKPLSVEFREDVLSIAATNDPRFRYLVGTHSGLYLGEGLAQDPEKVQEGTIKALAISRDYLVWSTDSSVSRAMVALRRDIASLGALLNIYALTVSVFALGFSLLSFFWPYSTFLTRGAPLKGEKSRANND